MGKTDYMAGLYVRLSKDDLRAGESVSVENQRLLLTKYAEEEGWEIRDIYIDDGWTGTNFERPAFQRMMQDVRDGRINVIVVKDLSRLGRNYIEVGKLTEETLPALGCRFIALNDSVDTMMGDNDMAVYRNLFNEFYSKDTSKKVRAVKRACMAQGKFMGTYAPIGYMRDPQDKHHLVIDEETAPIVRRMFAMRSQGIGFRAIATTFNEEKVPSPKQIYYRRNGRENPRKENGIWNMSSVKVILRNEVYAGHMVQGKTGTVSYKNHKLVGKPEEQWVRVENTHEPLIDPETWETVRLLDEKGYMPRKCADGPQSKFVGLLRCADCGFTMKCSTEKGVYKNGDPWKRVYFICGNYARSGKSACTVHSISEAVLTELVLHDIRANAQRVEWDEHRVMRRIVDTKNREGLAYLTTYRQELKAAETRLVELERIMQTLYEDRVRGVVTESMFQSLMPKYERERTDKTDSLKILRDKVEQGEQQWCDVDAWAKAIRKYAALETLSQAILLELIDHIDISAPVVVNGQRECHVNIVYRFVGDVSNSLAGLEVETYEQAV
ncbi:recombinase family protein [Ruminococcaceae bacterium OttesenSCG-928-D13]|nr:recombinase family protein [Ruminococcaceae bacterium OttesenSCG-928-D13]